jgi:hypothetical protein
MMVGCLLAAATNLLYYIKDMMVKLLNKLRRKRAMLCYYHSCESGKVIYRSYLFYLCANYPQPGDENPQISHFRLRLEYGFHSSHKSGEIKMLPCKIKGRFPFLAHNQNKGLEPSNFSFLG